MFKAFFINLTELLILSIGNAICFSTSFVERIGWNKKPFFYTEPRFCLLSKFPLAFFSMLTYSFIHIDSGCDKRYLTFFCACYLVGEGRVQQFVDYIVDLESK